MRRATLADAAVVLSILDEASAWLRSRGIDQWPERFGLGWIGPSLESGQTWLAFVDREPVGTITLSDSDPMWPEDRGDALYVHRVAVRRTAAGLGGVLLDWADATARQQGRLWLRLDCVATNGALRAYYEQRGFVHRGDEAVEGPPRRRWLPAHLVTVSRYERAAGFDTEAGRGAQEAKAVVEPRGGDRGFVIAPDDPRREDVRALLADHRAFAHGNTPIEHSHTLDPDARVDSSIAFFSARLAGRLVAVGALRELDPNHGEVKSMHTTEAARGRGAGRAMLDHLIASARGRGYARLSLETGVGTGFEPARRLYERAGFAPCEPFGDYSATPDNCFMTLCLE